MYHCVDYVAEYPGVDRTAFEKTERQLVQVADLVIGSSRPFVAHLETLGARDVRYWPNPADTKSFAAAVSEDRNDGPPIAGFAGAIDPHKIDTGLLLGVAESLPEWSFHLVGPGSLDRPLPAKIRSQGYVGRDKLPAIVAGFTRGIIPYALTPYMAGVFPMKVFEYLAAGLPVVSTPLPSLVGEVDYVAFAADVPSFVSAIEVGSGRGIGIRRNRREYAGMHSSEGVR